MSHPEIEPVTFWAPVPLTHLYVFWALPKWATSTCKSTMWHVFMSPVCAWKRENATPSGKTVSLHHEVRRTLKTAPAEQRKSQNLAVGNSLCGIHCRAFKQFLRVMAFKVYSTSAIFLKTEVKWSSVVYQNSPFHISCAAQRGGQTWEKRPQVRVRTGEPWREELLQRVTPRTVHTEPVVL